MDLSSFERISECAWRIPAVADMRVPVVIYASEQLAHDMDEKVREQAVNVATLPGIVQAVYVMPDAHWGYGFPIGGVAAFAAEQGGVISAGGVGFDISCGVRTLTTELAAPEVEAVGDVLASDLARSIPAGLGREGKFPLDPVEMEEMLSGGAAWAVARGWGFREDLERIEEGGHLADADAAQIALGVTSAVILVAIGIRTAWIGFRARLGLEAPEDVVEPGHAFVTAVAATALNPLTIALWAVSFPALAPGSAASSTGDAAVLLAGVGVGTLLWYGGLSTAVALTRRRFGPRLVAAVDVGAGAGLIAFGSLLAYRTVDDRG